MSTKRETNAERAAIDRSLPVEAQLEKVNEAVGEYGVGSTTIDNDTRLSLDGDTESILTSRPVRGSVIRSLQKSKYRADQRRESNLFRGDGTTSHTRRDLLTGDWTIYAPMREQRPNEFVAEQLASAPQPYRESSGVQPYAIDPACPFCMGAEDQTPEAVWSAKIGQLSAEDSDHASTRFARPSIQVVQGEQQGWDVRVVPNKFPAVSSFDSGESICGDGQLPFAACNLFPITNVVGGHEVIVESGTHAETMTDLDPSLIYVTLMAYRERLRHWQQVPGVNYISVFKNCGPDAGASLRHSHSQLIATSLVPDRIRTMLLRCENHRARTGCSLGCDLLRAELTEKSRVIDRTDSMVAFCPFASRFPGMVRITSVAHQPHFETFNDAELDQLSSFLYRVLAWVGQAFPGKAFNYLLHTCPPGSGQPEAFQWSLDVFPRLSKTAGFEWSCDCMINSLLPEAAASRYREIARQNDPRRVLALA